MLAMDSAHEIHICEKDLGMEMVQLRVQPSFLRMLAKGKSETM